MELLAIDTLRIPVLADAEINELHSIALLQLFSNLSKLSLSRLNILAARERSLDSNKVGRSGNSRGRSAGSGSDGAGSRGLSFGCGGGRSRGVGLSGCSSGAGVSRSLTASANKSSRHIGRGGGESECAS